MYAEQWDSRVISADDYYGYVYKILCYVDTHYGENITMMVKNKEGAWKWIASVSSVSFITGRGDSARYLALGYNDDSEVLVGGIDLFPDD